VGHVLQRRRGVPRVYWHNNFGTPQSHGCVGMPNYRAKQIYDWSPTGVDVWIHD
jgi:lipoprotein-anchoring transpeptidase ErfK/SrfK